MTQQENGGHTQQLKIKSCNDGAREGDKQLMMLYKARHTELKYTFTDKNNETTDKLRPYWG